MPKVNKRPSDGLQKPKSPKEIPQYLMKVIKGFFSRLFYIVSLVFEAAPMLLLAMTVLCILNGLLPVIGAYISKELLNSVADRIVVVSGGGTDISSTLEPLIFLLIIYFIYNFLNKITTRIDTMITTLAGERVVNHIKLKIINKSKEVDMSSFDRPEFYEKLENANREATMRPIHILTYTFNVLSALISSISFIAVLSGLSPYAPLIVILAAIPSAIVSFLYRTRNFRYMRMHSKERREMQYFSSLMVNKDNVKEIRILGLGERFISKYKDAFGRYYKGLRKLIIGEGLTQLCISFVSTAASALLFLYVAYNVVFHGGEIGDWSLYTGALTSIVGYVSTVFTSSAAIYEGTLFINNMMEFMAEKPCIVPTEGEGIDVIRGKHRIEFKNVSFSYPDTDITVLKNINLTFEPDDTAVLVGLNGAGKTTLIKLLTRLYDPTEGVILLDGRDIRDYNTASLYDLFGIVFQDYGKYALTAAENIELGDASREPERERVVRAASSSDADAFISELPQGYDTPLTRIFDENGTELSGGQWQKLSVARAFYKNSDIMIMDEPTASLDAVAEGEVFKQFYELSEGKMSIFVSHRLSSAANASKIIVIDRGEISEVGTHEELMEKKGEYYTLFTTQASRYTSQNG